MRSMTGYAKVREELPDAAVEIEIRSLNSRFLKITTSLTGVPLAREDEILGRVRRVVERGTVHLGVHYRPVALDSPYRVNRVALSALLLDIQSAAAELGHAVRIDPAALLVHDWLLEPADVPEEALERDWPRILAALDQAMTALSSMRDTEGAVLGKDLRARATSIATAVEAIRGRVLPHLEEFKQRLRNRIAALLGPEGLPVREEDLIRELVYYAERSDISEELERIASHLAQYFDLLAAPGEVGRKLEFVVQELLREVNTVGSKTYDKEAASAVIGIKSELEKIKEQLQNVE